MHKAFTQCEALVSVFPTAHEGTMRTGGVCTAGQSRAEPGRARQGSNSPGDGIHLGEVFLIPKSSKLKKGSKSLGHMPIILVFVGQKQEDCCEFKASLGHGQKQRAHPDKGFTADRSSLTTRGSTLPRAALEAGHYPRTNRGPLTLCLILSAHHHSLQETRLSEIS